MPPRRVLMLSACAAMVLAAGTLWLRARGVWGPAPTCSCAVLAGDDVAASDPADDGPLLTPHMVDHIEPGTRTPDGPPAGWTYLIFKAHNRLASGDIDALPNFARPLAEFLFTVMAARVSEHREGGQPHYQLDAVGIGMGTRVGDDDMIISNDTHRRLGANLGILKPMVLERAEERLNTIVTVAATPTMMIVDAPTIICLDDQHRNLVMRYVVMVDPASGQLHTTVWRIDTDDKGQYLGAVGQAILMDRDLLSTSPLHVDGKRIFGGIPTTEAFAVTQMPAGMQFDLPAAMAPLAGRRQFTAKQAASLETALRQAIVALPPPAR